MWVIQGEIFYNKAMATPTFVGFIYSDIVRLFLTKAVAKSVAYCLILAI